MNAFERAQALVAKLQESLIDVNGNKCLPLNDLNDLVRSDPEATAIAVPKLLEAGKKYRPAYQIALSLARVYEDFFKDDSLLLLVEQDLASLTEPLSFPKYAGFGVGDETTPGAQHVQFQLYSLDVNAADLEAGSVYPLVRIFRVDSDRPNKLLVRSFRDQFVLSFPLDSDPRQLWAIPSARAYMARLFDEIAYMPYYLASDPQVFSFLTFFAPLADKDALDDNGIHNLMHPSVINSVIHSLRAVQWLAKLVDDDAGVCREILQGTPDEFQTSILSRLDVVK